MICNHFSESPSYFHLMTIPYREFAAVLAVIFWKDLRQAGIPSQFIDDSNNEILVATSTATGQTAGCSIAIAIINNVQLNFCGILTRLNHWNWSLHVLLNCFTFNWRKTINVLHANVIFNKCFSSRHEILVEIFSFWTKCDQDQSTSHCVA